MTMNVVISAWVMSVCWLCAPQYRNVNRFDLRWRCSITPCHLRGCLLIHTPAWWKSSIHHRDPPRCPLHNFSFLCGIPQQRLCRHWVDCNTNARLSHLVCLVFIFAIQFLQRSHTSLYQYFSVILCVDIPVLPANSTAVVTFLPISVNCFKLEV